MRKIIIFIALVGLVGISAWLFVPNDPKGQIPAVSATTPEQSSSPALTAVAGAKSGSAHLYDVRSPEEFAQRHVDGAVNFSIETMKAGSLPTVAKDSPIYVYCRSGNRSSQATKILQTNGFTNVTDLGGLADLEKAGVL